MRVWRERTWCRILYLFTMASRILSCRVDERKRALRNLAAWVIAIVRASFSVFARIDALSFPHKRKSTMRKKCMRILQFYNNLFIFWLYISRYSKFLQHYRKFLNISFAFILGFKFDHFDFFFEELLTLYHWRWHFT